MEQNLNNTMIATLQSIQQPEPAAVFDNNILAAIYITMLIEKCRDNIDASACLLH